MIEFKPFGTMGSHELNAVPVIYHFLHAMHEVVILHFFNHIQQVFNAKPFGFSCLLLDKIKKRIQQLQLKGRIATGKHLLQHAAFGHHFLDQGLDGFVVIIPDPSFHDFCLSMDFFPIRDSQVLQDCFVSQNIPPFRIYRVEVFLIRVHRASAPAVQGDFPEIVG